LAGASRALSSTFGAAAVAAILACSLTTPARVDARAVTPRGELSADERATINLFERSKRAVVFISTTERVVDFWSRNVTRIPRGTGSGFVWDDQGHIVTNYHVIAGASEARVRLNDGRDYAAVLVGASRAHDLAVLRIRVPSNPPPALPIGTSNDLRVGQSTYAIGNPFGLDWTLTTGTVSALDRSLTEDDGNAIEHLIQTDAAINPGNSGGPLLDSAGRLIGVTTLIFSPSGAYAGIGFAVPVDTVNRVVPELIAHGRYLPPYLGIEVDENVNELLASRLRLEGVFALRVAPGSPAAEAGIVGVRQTRDGGIIPGDAIVAIDGKPVSSVARFNARLDDYRAGDTVRLTLSREGRKVEVKVTLSSTRRDKTT